MFSRLKTFAIVFGLVITFFGVNTTIAHAAVSVVFGTDPDGLPFSVDGVTFTHFISLDLEAGSIHEIGVTSPLFVGTTRYAFLNWSDGGDSTHQIIIPNVEIFGYRANFQPQFLLTTAVSPTDGGSVTIDPPSEDGYYPLNTSIVLTAVPNTGYSFSYWNEDPTDTVNPKSLTIDSSSAFTAVFERPSHLLHLSAGGAARYDTAGNSAQPQKSGYAKLAINSATAPYGTAIFVYKQNGITVSEAGVPASPPTTHARVFIDHRIDSLAIPGRPNSGMVDFNTGIGVANYGTATAHITYTLLDSSGLSVATGNGILSAGNHFAKFINQLADVASGFFAPSNLQFGSLDIFSDQPISIMALRMTINQRDESLYTTTPVADLSHSFTFDSIFFPQLVDGGGYTTALVLLNSSATTERGTIQFYDESGQPLVVQQAGGVASSSFPYSIPTGGVFRFQTDGSSIIPKSGWVQVNPSYLNTAPIGSAVFSYNPADVLLTESGVPSALPTTHARIYVDLTQNHNTGLALTNISSAVTPYLIKAFQTDGSTLVGSNTLFSLPARGHSGQFTNQLIPGLPSNFTGVLDISSVTPFAALTLRSLMNQRGDFLITTLPIADYNQPAPSPVLFPHIVDGGGFSTQFILLNPGDAVDASLVLYNDAGGSFENN
jgi:hypothetical protein